MKDCTDPALVAEVIYQAATDGTDRIRYLAGEDAKTIIAKRTAEDDATYTKGVREQFSL